MSSSLLLFVPTTSSQIPNTWCEVPNTPSKIPNTPSTDPKKIKKPFLGVGFQKLNRAENKYFCLFCWHEIQMVFMGEAINKAKFVQATHYVVGRLQSARFIVSIPLLFLASLAPPINQQMFSFFRLHLKSYCAYLPIWRCKTGALVFILM